MLASGNFYLRPALRLGSIYFPEPVAELIESSSSTDQIQATGHGVGTEEAARWVLFPGRKALRY